MTEQMDLNGNVAAKSMQELLQEARGGWLAGEKERIDKENAENLKKQGFKPVFELKQGENVVDLSLVNPPKKVTTKWGDRYVYDLKEPADLSLMASEYLHSEIVSFLLDNNTTKLKIVRVGEEKNTRYTILPVE